MIQFLHLTHETPRAASWTTLGWAAILLLSLAAVVIAMGAPLGPVALLSGVISFLFAYRYPYAMYGLLVVLIPFLGLTVSLPTGKLAFGVRAFGGSIDVSVAELVAMALVAAWGAKVVMLWWKRNDVNWKPWLPLFLPMAALVAAHIVSSLSVFHPDQVLVVKAALRPVAWCYLIYVVLTVNLIRSRSRLASALGALVCTGMLAALMGFISLGMPSGAGGFPRAHPLPLFGIMPLGDNHNLLAEWLVVTVPATLALLLLSSHPRTRRLLGIAAAFQAAIALLTFARSAWIVLALEALCFAWLVWRDRMERWLRPALVGVVCLLPLAAVMFAVSSTAIVAGSTSTRVMLSEIAFSAWQASPWVGMGAGTFVERVGATQVFLIEYGAPLDAHGWGQKLLAETGIFGIAAAVWLVVAATRYAKRTRERLVHRSLELRVFTLLATGALGALTYQLFNTSYWTGKLWLPLGLMLAASRALQSTGRQDDRV